MRFRFWMILVFTLSGCATATSVNLSSNSIASEASFLFADERSEKQKSSYQQTDSSGRNVYFGDNTLNPTGPQLLKGMLQQNLSIELTGKKIVLTDFLVIVTDPTVSIDKARLQATSAQVPNGVAVTPLAEALIYSIESGKKNVYIRITGKVGNNDYSNQNSRNFWAGASESDIKSLINKTLDDSVKEIRNIVTKK
ncbi:MULTISPECIES: hypothetical protein [Methylotenera]|uniref:hypothetical protein n=1 Tax=Methylotenera TaxID=359407 RepID=UPI00039E3C04|nr:MULTISPECIES: hypothetical protein [Methylotenera]